VLKGTMSETELHVLRARLNGGIRNKAQRGELRRGLVDARDGSTRPATDVIEADDIKAAAAISATLEGGTEHQKNPHKKGTLAWLSWIAAPPGPKTMARGLDCLIDRIEGFRLANERWNV
jgi:hypothetical protein